jgi:hypothetical protein
MRLGWPGLILLALLSGLAAAPSWAQGATDDCDENNTAGLQRALHQATSAYVDYGITAGRSVYAEQPITNKLSCLNTLLNYFNIIAAIVNGIVSLAGIIIGIIAAIISQACSAIASWINYALNLICLPLPSFNFGLNAGLPTAGSACNGLSFGTLMQVQGGNPFQVPNPFLSTPLNSMSRGVTDPLTGKPRF